LSVDPAAMERMTGQGTSNLGAYLAFLQGRALLANVRVVDMTEAIGHFERSVKLDPTFAGAYVSLAEAEVFLGEYEATDDRQERFKRALLRGQELVEKAHALIQTMAPPTCSGRSLRRTIAWRPPRRTTDTDSN
ncbi:MAG TPA: hypothetical protein VJK00_02155, partial [Steroidobacteraceae bacterium]|nr:hypothetical protein [Steroidobacteraceae bacterium]